jgi:DNA-binding GntR family transcriptional regulator
MSASLAIERLSTAERVADALRQELLSGVYAPGTPLRDTELSARAGVSRTTVREALALLAREGLVTHSLHRGVEVARLAPADVRDVYALRRVIERAGAEALLGAAPGALAPLERAVREMGEAAARRDGRRVVEADVAFHTAIGDALGIRRLRAALVGALLELRLVLSVTDRAYDDLEDQLRQHRELLRLFRERRPEVIAAIDEHLVQAEALVIEGVKGVALRSGGEGAGGGSPTGSQQPTANGQKPKADSR